MKGRGIKGEGLVTIFKMKVHDIIRMIEDNLNP